VIRPQGILGNARLMVTELSRLASAMATLSAHRARPFTISQYFPAKPDAQWLCEVPW